MATKMPKHVGEKLEQSKIKNEIFCVCWFNYTKLITCTEMNNIKMHPFVFTPTL
jgi:hypothetical protein